MTVEAFYILITEASLPSVTYSRRMSSGTGFLIFTVGKLAVFTADKFVVSVLATFLPEADCFVIVFAFYVFLDRFFLVFSS